VTENEHRAESFAHGVSTRRRSMPDVVIQPSDGPPVHLLLVAEWADTVSFHLAWPWRIDDVRANLRQAYRLEDATGRSLPVVDSRVMPLAGRMNEVTYFDTRDLAGPQTLFLRLRCQLAGPLAVPIG
jgi:hypothetical protein